MPENALTGPGATLLSPSRVSRRARRALPLPAPPDDAEKYWYMGRQHRWLLWLQASSFASIAYSVFRFATADSRLLLFTVPMSLYTVTLIVSLLSGSRAKRTDRLDHELRVAEYAPTTYPSVDVFLPTAGESLEVLENTYQHVAALNWPGRVLVWVLDDGARDEVRVLAQAYGLQYRSRPDRGRLKKAGNLGYGYRQSDGDFIAIFDADFCPRADFLHELVPYFEDPRTGIVQSPQYFDAVKGMFWLKRCAGATQELFYRWIQPSRDRSKAAICVGTCALYRRSALEEAGGFAQIGHSEDVHTGVNLMRVGYEVKYVPIIVSKGICPEDLSSFLNQQYRWCTGSMSLLVDKTFHENRLIGPRQRLCFWAGFLYYISTGLNAFLAPIPGLAMLYLLPSWIEPANSVWLVGALVMWTFVVPILFKSRWRIDVLRVQYLYSFAHAVAIFHVLTGRTKEWVATGATAKSGTPIGTQVSRVMRTYLALSLTLIWIGLFRATATYGLHQLWAMIALAVLGAYIQVPMLLLHPREPRSYRPRDLVTWLRQQRVSRPRLRRQPAPAPAAAPAPTSAPATPALAPALARTAERPPALTTPAPAAALAATGNGERGFRRDIQGLRAVAVLLVVLYHANLPWVPGGYVGVDVFFVISGFLISGQLVRELATTGRINVTGFYAGRIRRLLPAALLVVVVTVVAARFADSLLRVRSVAWDGVFTAFYGLNYRLASMGVDYQQSDGPASPLLHFWSLAVEEQFYLLWPLLLVAVAFLGRRRYRASAAALVVTTIGVSLALSVTLTHSNAPLAYFSLQTRAWELAVGAGVSLLTPFVRRAPAALLAGAGWVGLAMIVVTGVVFTDETRFPGSAALWPVLGAALVILGGARLVRPGAESLLSRAPFQVMGKFSYGWYLWHWPLLVLVPMMMNRDFTWLQNLELVVIALWWAVIGHHLVESPAIRSRLRKPAWLRLGAVATVATAVLAFAVATTVPVLAGSGAKASTLAVDPTKIAAVQQYLGKSLATREVPSNLTPTLTRAQFDQPASTFDGCHANFLVIEQPACVYGDPAAARTVVLMGDSHMQQWLPAFDAAGKTGGWKVVAWTKAACPVADVTLVSSALKRVYTECTTWRTKTEQRIAALKPDLLVLSQSDNVPGTQLSDQAWADGTAATANRMRSTTKRLLFMMDTPIPGSDAPACLAQHLDNAGACIRDVAKAYSIPARHTAVAAALRDAGVTTSEPLHWFCTNAACPMVVGNMLVYRDTTHMTTAYSAWLAPLVEPLLR